MPEPIDILRAPVEAIVPGPPHHPVPGVLEAGADAFVAGVLARIGPEGAEGVPMVLVRELARRWPGHARGPPERSSPVHRHIDVGRNLRCCHEARARVLAWG